MHFIFTSYQRRNPDGTYFKCQMDKDSAEQFLSLHLNSRKKAIKDVQQMLETGRTRAIVGRQNQFEIEDDIETRERWQNNPYQSKVIIGRIQVEFDDKDHSE